MADVSIHPEPAAEPLDEIIELIRALRAALQAAPQGDHTITLTVSEPFAPVSRADGSRLILDAAAVVSERAGRVRNLMAEACTTAVLIEMGGVVRTGAPRPSPELAARLRSTGESVRQKLVAGRGVARLLAAFPDLPGFIPRLEAYRADPPQLSEQELAFLHQDGVSLPDLRHQTCPPALTDWLREFNRIFRRALRRPPGPNGRCRLKLPDRFRPVGYADGMRTVWSLTDEIHSAVKELDLRFGEFCRAVVRAQFTNGVRAEATGPELELLKDTQLAASAVLTIVEDLTCHAGILAHYRTAEDLLSTART